MSNDRIKIAVEQLEFMPGTTRVKVGGEEFMFPVACIASGRQLAVSSFHPLDLAPGVFLWPTNNMYQDAGTTLATDADHPIKQWNNLGSGGHAIAPTDAKRPLLKLNIQNGLRAALGDGSDDCLQIASLPLSTFSMWSVFKASGDGLIYEHSADSGSNDGCYLYTATGETVNVRRTDRSAKNKGVGTWGADGTMRIVRQDYGGTHALHKLAINGVDQSLTDAVSNDPGTGEVTATLNIFARNGGASVCLPGHLIGLIAISPIPSAENIALVDAWVAEQTAIS